MVIVVSISFAAFKVQRVAASGTIYIRADGSIYPSTTLVSTMDNVTYFLTDNFTSEADGIAIMRNNIIVDGVGYTVQGIGGGGGFSLSGVNNITIKNTNIKHFGIGVYI
ncbi:MAG TPA: hypothetical protein VMS94_04040, partial [Acidobacteriota bacterium]|nr:hypothetical protein [Acidobacteriota bacterium]